MAIPVFAETVQFIINASEVLENYKKNIRSILTSCAVWVSRTGLEPPNYWDVIECGWICVQIV
jgi:hypothetical protein